MFRADLDSLDDVVRRLGATHDELEEVASLLGRRVAVLHDHWDGVAAGAHADAHAQWEQGFAQMRAALSELRSAAHTAHDNYLGAAETNLAMWRRLG